MDNYKRIEILGQGAYGKVYKAQDLRNGNLVALKKALSSSDEEGIPPTTLREISILKSVSECEFIVKLLDVVNSKSKNGKISIYIVFQYLDGDLKSYMISKYGKGRGMNEYSAKKFCFQLLIGMYHCHKLGIIHRDLKPQNILIEKGEKLKIADFGLSRNFSIPVGKYTHEVVTLWYRAPEILLGARTYSSPVDIWSIGCIFAEMLTGNPLFCGESEIEQLLSIFKTIGTPTSQTWPEVLNFKDWHEFPIWPQINLKYSFKNISEESLEFIQVFLRLNPNKRISILGAMTNTYFEHFFMEYNLY